MLSYCYISGLNAYWVYWEMFCLPCLTVPLGGESVNSFELVVLRALPGPQSFQLSIVEMDEYNTWFVYMFIYVYINLIYMIH